MTVRLHCQGTPVSALLAEMLVPVPYKVSEKKAEKKATGTRRGLRHEAALDASPEEDEVHFSHEGEERKKKKKAASTEGVEGSKKAATGTRKGHRCRAVIELSSENDEEDSPPEDGGEHEEMPPPRTREEKKRKSAPSGEAGTPKKGKASLPNQSTTAAFSDDECLPRGKPRARL